MSNGFESDKQWAAMLQNYQSEKQDGRRTMTHWRKCFEENRQLKGRLAEKSKVTVHGFNPVRDRFSSPERDQKYFKSKNTTVFAKKKSNQSKGRSKGK